MKTKIFIILMLLCYSWNVTTAQSFNLEPGASQDNLLGLKASLPSLKNAEGDGLKAMSGLYTLYAAIPVSDGFSIYAELPWVVANDEYSSETGFGNIMLTARAALNEKRTSQVSFGFFIPTISKEKYDVAGIGYISNFYRLSQMARAFTFYTNYSYVNEPAKKFIFGLETGPEFLFPTEDVDSDIEVLLHFSILAGYRIQKLNLWAELNDIMMITESDLDFFERNINQLSFCGQFDFGKLKPGVCYMIPLKDYYNDYVRGAIGAKLDFTF